ncbi:MAG TPA: hypothetical protein VMW52_11455 [Phycisphaerae bacterium]|nr:hypothetical protein [Phycisphaerae bacterium]
MANQTVEQCEANRKACPGHAALPLRVHVFILVAIVLGICSTFVLLSSQIATAREATIETRTELRIRADRLGQVEAKLDSAIDTLNDIRATLRKPQPKKRTIP